MTREELWQRLEGEQLVSGVMPVEQEVSTPWPVRAMLGVAGWIGAVFLLVALGMAFAALFRSEEAALPAGVACCAAAYGIFLAARSDFLSQFGFATSLVGQALVGVGLVLLVGEKQWAVALALMTVFEMGLVALVPNYVHRVFCTLVAVVCFALVSFDWGFYGLAAAVASAGTVLVWVDERLMARKASLWEPVGFGLAIALLHLDGALLFGDLWRMLFHRPKPTGLALWLGPAIASAAFLYAMWRLLERSGVRPQSSGARMAMGAAGVVSLCGLIAPGISASVLVIMLGFANGSRVLLGLGVVAFGGYLSHFYYSLTWTLLEKSIALVATGVVLLVVRWWLTRLTEAEEAAHG